MKKWLLFLSLFAVLPVSAEELSEAEYREARKYIVEMSQDWAGSVVTGDKSKLQVYFAEDFQGTFPDGTRYDKAFMVAQEPMKEFVSNLVNQVDVRFFGKTAIAYGDETLTMRDGTAVTLVWTDIWLYRKGQWQVVAAQDVFREEK